ncbi:GerAB/ArcD/ProY family transporter [Lederbergia lenta]|uniref:Spore germination protein n=1 Tax=Lederbergia lenta TaxID=1467 RepID=A0A2X4W5M4_LEDLE|nr:endospore germination permease [Lederbergia lenta]MCM3109714.1 spore germination protein [Lederbergia lenta]MEC2324535.1 endospore germination permease [Lederbergia lenta]SQI59506.1 spore germination protein [Lederbergia lenta]
MTQLREITLVQTTTILISTIIGVGVLRLPLIAVRAADTGAPFITFLAVIISFIGLWAITKLGIQFPNQSIIHYSEKILGKWLGRLYGWMIIIFFLALTGFTSREFGAVVVTAVLKETPLEVTVIVMLFLAAIFTRDNINTFAYIHNFYVPIILVPVLIIVAVSLKNADPLYLQPIFVSESTGMLLNGTLTIAALFQGAFIMTIIIPFMQKPKKAMKATIWGIFISGALYIMIVIATLAVFGPEEMKKTMWPTLELARATSLPGNILQRLDVVFLAVWVTAVFTTIFSSYMFSVQALKQIFRLQDHKLFSYFLLPIVFVIAMLPENTLQMYQIIGFVGKIGLLITIVSPFLLLIIAKLRKLTVKKGED